MKCLYSRFLASQAKTIIHYPINLSVRPLYSQPLFVKANTFRFTIIPPQLIGSRSGKFVTTSYPQKIIQAILESSSFAMRVKSTFRCFCFVCGHEYTYIIQTYVYIYTYIYIYIYIYVTIYICSHLEAVCICHSALHIFLVYKYCRQYEFVITLIECWFFHNMHYPLLFRRRVELFYQLLASLVYFLFWRHGTP
jgi:hypothetical protein